MPLQVCEGEYLYVAQPCDYLAGGNKHGIFGRRLVLWLADAGRQYYGSVVGRHLLIRPVQIRLIEARSPHAALQVVRHKSLGDAAQILKGVDMAGYPGGQLLVAERLDVDDPGTRQDGNEQRGLLRLPALLVEEGDPCSGPVDLERQRGLMLQTDGGLVHPGVLVIVAPELRLHVEALAVSPAFLHVLLPEQLQGYVGLGKL